MLRIGHKEFPPGQTEYTNINIFKEITSYNSYLNTGTPSLSKTNYGRSTAAHELGHAIGLDDLSSGNSLMSHSRDRSLIYTPQSDDLQGVNAIYNEI